MPKAKVRLKEVKHPKIEGLNDFPLNLLGLTPESIEMSNGHVRIPRELLPYIKICKLPKPQRDQVKKRVKKYRLKLKARESYRHLKETRKRKSSRKED